MYFTCPRKGTVTSSVAWDRVHSSTYHAYNYMPIICLHNMHSNAILIISSFFFPSFFFIGGGGGRGWWLHGLRSYCLIHVGPKVSILDNNLSPFQAPFCSLQIHSKSETLNIHCQTETKSLRHMGKGEGGGGGEAHSTGVATDIMIELIFNLCIELWVFILKNGGGGKRLLKSHRSRKLRCLATTTSL